MTKIYLVSAEHWTIPGIKLAAFPTHADALSQADVEINALLKMAKLEPRAVASEADLEIAESYLHDKVGARYARVSIDEIELHEPPVPASIVAQRHYQCFVDNNYAGPKFATRIDAEGWAERLWGYGEDCEWVAEERLDLHSNPSWVCEIDGREIYVIERMGRGW